MYHEVEEFPEIFVERFEIEKGEYSFELSFQDKYIRKYFVLFHLKIYIPSPRSNAGITLDARRHPDF